ncbi:hypothetical protein ABZ622_01550 [Streptomyces sp. NPDC007164]|uniref:hypothetical protein n=1 Tax=Streptomyces sp. NPDC007164 TaxID=3156918 RepID=UPI0033EA43C5
MTGSGGRTRWRTGRFGRGGGCEGQTAIEYVGIGAVVLALILAMLVAGRASGVGVTVGGRLCEAVAAIGAGEAGDCAGSGADDSGPGDEGDGGDGSSDNDVGDADESTPTASDSPGGDAEDGEDGEEDPFEPDKCLLSSDDRRTTTRIQILFFKISSSEQVTIEQWSDGSVTLSRNVDVGAGVEGGVSAGIGKLGNWSGEAELSAGYNWSSGSGGQWIFNAHKEGASLQEDLEHNVEDAKKYAKLLAKTDECGSDPDPEGQIACSAAASWFVPDQDPEKAPDVDISRTTTEASGEVGFGLSTHKGSDEDDNVANVGASGSMSDDVTVLRAQSGEDAGKITFVYTFTMSGKLEADAAGRVGASGEGTHMQQVAVTYDAEKYDKEEDDGKPHHPENMEITTSQQGGVVGKGDGSTEVEVSAGSGLTLSVEGGAGSSTSTLHTESASVDLDTDEKSAAVEDWLRGRGKHPAKGTLPSPRDAAEPLAADASPVQKLLHDNAKVTSLDYDVNKDWWDTSLAIGIGVAAGSVNLGFKLFGLSVEHEETEQTITGNPTYAGRPEDDGTRPWKPFTKCTDVRPVES